MCYYKPKCILRNISVVCSFTMKDSGWVHSEILKPYFLLLSLIR